MTENEQIMKMSDDIRRIRESYYGGADYLFAKKMFEDGYRKVERGEWIENGSYNNCSRCGGEVARYDANDYYQDFALCPNCGADMRGKGNEDTERA